MRTGERHSTRRDLADAPSLDRATDGVDVIISAVQGGPDFIVKGQVALAEAGKRNGVPRILPSDFGLGCSMRRQESTSP